MESDESAVVLSGRWQMQYLWQGLQSAPCLSASPWSTAFVQTAEWPRLEASLDLWQCCTQRVGSNDS